MNVLFICTGNVSRSAVAECILRIVMEHYHYVQAQKELPYAQWYKLHQITKYCYGDEFNIEDPLYDDKEYDFAFHQIESCCKIILNRI